MSSDTFLAAPRWSDEELDRDRKTAVDLFRASRIQEPRDKYARLFEDALSAIAALFKKTKDLTEIEQQASTLIEDETSRDLIRFLAAPPVSNDDLRLLMGITSFSKRDLP